MTNRIRSTSAENANGCLWVTKEEIAAVTCSDQIRRREEAETQTKETMQKLKKKLRRHSSFKLQCSLYSYRAHEFNG